MIDIIIVNYNSTDYLVGCLESVLRSLDGIPAKIHVQDNASSDGVENIKDKFPQVLLVQNKKNIGFAAAVNKAWVLGDNPFVVLLNPDTIVSENFFKTSLSFMKTHPSVGIMGPKVLEKGGRLQNSARSFPTLLTAFFGRTSILTRLFPNNSITLKNLPCLASDGSTPMEVDWVSGACMVVNRKAADRIGGLDERFFLYWEDADWCRRMWESRQKVIYYPKASVYHFTGASSQRELLKSVVEFHKSVFRFIEKQEQSFMTLLMKSFILFGLLVRSGVVLASHLVKKG